MQPGGFFVSPFISDNVCVFRKNSIIGCVILEGLRILFITSYGPGRVQGEKESIAVCRTYFIFIKSFINQVTEVWKQGQILYFTLRKEPNSIRLPFVIS